MSATVDQIVVNLQDQVRIYQRLLDLSNAQLAALKTQDVHSVHAILQEIELAMLDRSKIEQRRTVILLEIASELGLPLEELTATLLQSVSDAPVAEAIAASSNQLRELVAGLDTAVAKNRVVLEQELSIIDHMVQGMTRVPEPPTYGKTGAQHEAARLKLLDMQV